MIPRGLRGQVAGFFTLCAVIIAAIVLNTVVVHDYPNPATRVGDYVVMREYHGVRVYFYWPIRGRGMRFTIPEDGGWTPNLAEAQRFVDEEGADSMAMVHSVTAVLIRDIRK